MRRIIAIFWLFMKTRIKGNIQYRATFWIDTVTFILGYGTSAAIMFMTVNKFDTLNGWKPFEVIMLYAYVLASYTLANSFLANVTFSLSENIRTGNFDQSMTKPLHPLLYEMANSFSDYYFLHFFLALGMVFFCVSRLSVEITFIKILMFILSIIGGALIQGGIWVLFSAATFSLIINPLNASLYNNIRPVIEYPISILPKPIQFFLSAIIPLAFVSFFPAQHLIGKDDTLFFPKIAQNLSLPVGIVFFFFSFQVWNISMKYYKSTGS